MKKAASTLKILAYIWTAIVGIIVLLSTIGIILGASNLVDGLLEVTRVFSPFNISNFIVTLVLLAPAFVLFKLSGYFKKKANKSVEKTK